MIIELNGVKKRVSKDTAIEYMSARIRFLEDEVKREHDRAEYNARCAVKNAQETFKVAGEIIQQFRGGFAREGD